MRILITVIIINLLMLFAAHTAQAKSKTKLDVTLFEMMEDTNYILHSINTVTDNTAGFSHFATIIYIFISNDSHVYCGVEPKAGKTKCRILRK